MTDYFNTSIGQREQFDRLLAQAGFTDEDVRRVLANPSLAGKMYNAIQPPRAVVMNGTPSWWRTPEQQLARARQLWPGIALPEPAKEFVSRTSAEVLLLHVPDTFDSLWSKVVAPEGYTKYRWEGVRSDKRHLRLAPNVPNRTTPVWLGFDPEHGKGKRPDSFWGQPNLAASEVLSALIQFPDWPLAWYKDGVSAPNLTGYQLKWDTAWSGVPCLSRWDDGRRLKLHDNWAGFAYGLWSSPVVRQC